MISFPRLTREQAVVKAEELSEQIIAAFAASLRSDILDLIAEEVREGITGIDEVLMERPTVLGIEDAVWTLAHDTVGSIGLEIKGIR